MAGQTTGKSRRGERYVSVLGTASIVKSRECVGRWKIRTIRGAGKREVGNGL